MSNKDIINVLKVKNVVTMFHNPKGDVYEHTYQSVCDGIGWYDAHCFKVISNVSNTCKNAFMTDLPFRKMLRTGELIKGRA